MPYMAGFMLGTGALSATSGGIDASRQQADIESSCCQLIDKMNSYVQSMNGMLSNLNQENAEVQTEIGDLMFSISGMQQQIRDKHSNFKKTYRNWCIVASIFMIILIFIFVTKIVILKASTKPK